MAESRVPDSALCDVRFSNRKEEQLCQLIPSTKWRSSDAAS